MLSPTLLLGNNVKLQSIDSNGYRERMARMSRQEISHDNFVSLICHRTHSSLFCFLNMQLRKSVKFSNSKRIIKGVRGPQETLMSHPTTGPSDLESGSGSANHHHNAGIIIFCFNIIRKLHVNAICNGRSTRCPSWTQTSRTIPSRGLRCRVVVRIYGEDDPGPSSESSVRVTYRVPQRRNEQGGFYSLLMNSLKDLVD